MHEKCAWTENDHTGGGMGITGVCMTQERTHMHPCMQVRTAHEKSGQNNMLLDTCFANVEFKETSAQFLLGHVVLWRGIQL